MTCDSHVFQKQPEHTQLDINSLRASKFSKSFTQQTTYTNNQHQNPFTLSEMDTALPNNVTKRACQDCRRRKIRCLHRQIEAQQEQPAQTPDRTINQDNFATMDRDYDYNTNKSSSTKRVRTGPQGQQPLSSAAGSSSAGPRSSSIPKGPQGQQPLPSAAGFSSSSIPKAAPVQAVFAGIPTTVPAPEDPVDMDDVEKFLSLLEVVVRAHLFPLPLF